MYKNLLFLLALCVYTPLFAQVNYTADDFVNPYDAPFRPGLNLGLYPGFTDEQLGDLSAGNPNFGNEGVGIKALRPGLFDDFTHLFGYDSRINSYEHFAELGMTDHTMIVGFPNEVNQDPNYYCAGTQSTLFKNMYEPIWDNGENGTPINENNHYAAYLWNVVTRYGDYVKFWEIWNEPGFDYSGAHGWLPPGADGNWWENNPDPCDYKLRAPIFNYVRLLRISWEIIKTEQPNDYVVVSGVGYNSFLDAILRNTDNPVDGSVTADYPNGGGAYFDVMGFHYYPHFNGVMREWNNDTQAWDYSRNSDTGADGISEIQADRYEVLDSHGYNGTDKPKKLWTITETNLPRKPYEDFIGSAESQVNFITKSYISCIQNGVYQFHVYKIGEDETWDDANYEFDLMGLYKKLSVNDLYYNERNDEGIALKTTTDILFGKTYDEAQTQALNLQVGMRGAAFADDDGNYTYVLWAETQMDNDETASAIYSFPTAFEIDMLDKRTWQHSLNLEMESVSSTNVVLTGAPIFLTPKLFSASVLSGCAPLTIDFADASGTAATSWLWTFEGDNAPADMTTANPSVTFLEKGNYTVQMQALDANSNVLATQTSNITVNAIANASFDYTKNGSYLIFENTSELHADEFLWDFGDGTMSTEANPDKIYLTSGTYEVTLSATNECSSDVMVQQITVDVPDQYLVDFNANEVVPPYTGDFRPGYNLKFFPPWADEQVADLAAGNPALDVPGVGAQAIRTNLGEFFVNGWSYDIRVPAFEHYSNIDIQDNTLTIGFPSVESLDTVQYCAGHNSELFRGLYEEIWDDGSDGTPYNEDNPYAVYLYNMVENYKDHVTFWEIYNAPDFDITGEIGWLPPGQPGNWWENNPEPCDYQLRAPVFHYIRLLRISYEIIKHLDEDSYVTISGLAFPAFLDAVCRNTDNPIDGSVVEGFELTGGAYFDAIGIKSFPHFDGTTAFYDVTIPGWNYQRHSDKAAEGIAQSKVAFQEVLTNYGYDGTQFPEKQWILSETNVPRKAFGDFMGSAEIQKNWIIKAYIEAERNDIRQMDILSIAELNSYEGAGDAFETMGLYQYIGGLTNYDQTIVNDEGIALKTVSDLLYKKEYDAARTAALQLPSNIGGAAYKGGDNEYVYALWAKTVNDLSENASATFAFPEWLNLGSVYARAWDYGYTNEISTADANAIELTGSPIFITANSEVLTAPLGNFTANTTLGCQGLQVQFEDLSSESTTQWFWEFEGGTPATSTAQHPFVTYNESGHHQVKLTAGNALGEHTVIYNEFIEITPVPTADFSYTFNGAFVQFVQESPSAVQVIWDFGDNQVSGDYAPEHFYFQNGDYEVELITINDCGADTITQIVTIALPPTADFLSETSFDCGATTMSFNDVSFYNPTAWNWTFEGGTPATSDISNPGNIVFETPGFHTITLEATNEFGTNTMSETVYIDGEWSFDINQTLCEDESIIIGGQVFDINMPSGVVELFTFNNCDSTYHVDLDFELNQETNLNIEILQGESYQVGNSIYTETGEYQDLLQSFNGCDSLVNLTLNVMTSTDELIVKHDIKAFPNPFDNRIIISIANISQAPILKIFDVNGRLVSILEKGNELGQFEWKSDNAPSGVYFAAIYFEDEVVMLRLVKE